MADNFSGIERLLGLPEGSTKDIDKDDAEKLLAKGVVNKTKDLNKKSEKIEVYDSMSTADIVKAGMNMETLEQDKETLRNEAFEVYRIAKTLLIKYKDDIEELVDVNDRMYTAGAKLVDSVTSSIDKLQNMILKFKQEEEIKNLSLNQEDEDDSKEMTPDQFIDYVDAVVEDEEEKSESDEKIEDAEIVDNNSEQEHIDK